MVIELKRDRATSPVVDQITAYMGWVMRNKALPSQSVRGIVIAPGMDHRVEFAIGAIPDLHFVDLNDIAGGLGLNLS